MDNENPTANQPPDKPSDTVAESQVIEPVDSTETTQSDTDSELRAVERKITGYEKSTLRWTRIVVLANVLTCFFVGLQWYEMKSGSVDTHTLAEAAKRQADKMSDVSGAADKIQQAAQNMVTQDQRIADNAKAASDASKTALDATIAESRMDQRAFVNFAKVMQDSPVLIPDKNEVQEWEFWPRMGNSGNTPTRNAHSHMSFVYLPTTIPDGFKYVDYAAPSPNTPFFLGPKEEGVTGPVAQIPISILQGVRDKTTHLYFWGWLTYHDIFPKTPLHISMFCMELADARGAFIGGSRYQFNYSLCPRHNCVVLPTKTGHLS
jgi:hypothetical protein